MSECAKPLGCSVRLGIIVGLRNRANAKSPQNCCVAPENRVNRNLLVAANEAAVPIVRIENFSLNLTKKFLLMQFVAHVFAP
jgi:hypothetical protein